MNVIAEKFREVAEVLESLDEPYVASVVKSYAEKSEAAAEFIYGPDAKLAQVLRESYYDGDDHSPVSSFPEQWLRMAAAARAHVAGEERARFARVDAEPRVFHQGEYIPADVSVLTDASGDTILRDGAGRWRYTRIGGEELTKTETWWAEPVRGYGPFTEVLS